MKADRIPFNARYRGRDACEWEVHPQTGRPADLTARAMLLAKGEVSILMTPRLTPSVCLPRILPVKLITGFGRERYVFQHWEPVRMPSKHGETTLPEPPRDRKQSEGERYL